MVSAIVAMDRTKLLASVSTTAKNSASISLGRPRRFDENKPSVMLLQ
jgi:hypothetical protein